MVDECLISWNDYMTRGAGQDLMTKATFKSRTSVWYATRGDKLTAVGRKLAAYHANRNWDTFNDVKNAFQDWRGGHGGAGGYKNDRRNNSGGMADLNQTLRDLEFVQLSDEHFVDMCEAKINGFRNLAAEVGDDRAREFSLLIKCPFYFNQQAQTKQFLEGQFQSEMTKINAAKAHIDKLATMAKTGALAQKLVKLPSARGQFHGNSAMDVAVAWVSGGSLTIGGTGSSNDGSEVRRELLRLNQIPRNWRKLQLCLEINKKVAGDDGEKPRKPHSEAPYPSHVGGRRSLEYTFQVASTFHPTNRFQWWNFSLFLFGGIVRSHGFGDGNGRTGRVMSAASAMATTTFIPLSKKQEYYLTQMKEGAAPTLDD